MPPQKLSIAETSHLLEWYACYCVTLAETCKHPRTAKLLRALSVDIAIEAARQRGILRRMAAEKSQKTSAPVEREQQNS